MAALLLQGEPELEIVLRRSARAKRLTLRVSGLDGRCTLTMPNGVSERDALAFAHEKVGWIRDQLNRREGLARVGYGVDVPIDGTPLRIAQAPGRAVRVKDSSVLVPGPESRVGARVAGYLKTRARNQFAQSADLYAKRLGRDYSGLTLRDTRSRWGSCTVDGRLMFSWRLVMAPRAVQDYVAAHEVAHLAVMNHSNAFWTTVEQIYGDHSEARTWLRQNGAGLHRFRF